MGSITTFGIAGSGMFQRLVLALAACIFLMLISDPALALNQPSFVSGDAESVVEESGERLFTVLSTVAGVVLAVAFIIGAILFGANQRELGTKVMVGSVIAGICTGLSGLIYYVAG